MSDGVASATPPVMVVTEQRIAEALQSLLRDANAFTSLNDVVQQLETKLGVDLSHKIDFIRAQIHHFLLLQSQPQNLMPHDQQKDNYALHQSPIFNPSSSPHLSTNFVAHQSTEDYGFSQQPPPPRQSSRPPPPPVVKTPNVATASVSAKERWFSNF